MIIVCAVLVDLGLAGCQTLDDMRASLATAVETAKERLSPTQADTSVAAQPQPIEARALPAPSSAATTADGTTSGRVAPEAVTDGDTIQMDGRRIRLHGIDAPEISQQCTVVNDDIPCGVIAREALRGFVMGSVVQCDRIDIDRYGRDVSRCYADGTDLSAAMVQAGWAVAYRQFSMNYVSHEDNAKKLQRGMWKGTFDMPWNWRARNP